MDDGIGFFLADDLPVTTLVFKVGSHLGVSIELVDDELFDDVPIDETCSFEGQWSVGPVVNRDAIGIVRWIMEEVDGKCIVEMLADEVFVLGKGTYLVATEGLLFVRLVKTVHGIVEEGAEHGIVHIVSHLIGGAQSCYIVEVELEGTLHVSVDGGGGEDVLVIESVMELLHHSCIFGDADGLRC